MQPLPGTPAAYGPSPYGLPAHPAPMPKGTPVRWPFIVGAVGHFLSAPVAVLLGIFLGGLFFGGFIPFGRGDFVALSALLLGATLVHLFGSFGIWRNYGPGIGLAAFVYGIVAAVFPLAGTVLMFTAGISTVGVVGAILFFVGIIALGVLFILEGVAFIVARHFTAMRGATTADGILFIVAGSLTASFFLAFVGFFLLIPAFILGGIVMVRAPVPASPPPGVPAAAAVPTPVPAPATAPGPAPPCPRCGRPLTFVPATQRWYCAAEGFYP